MNRPLIILCLVLIPAAGCSRMGRHVRDGMDCYRIGQYPGAIATFEGVQNQEHRMNDKLLLRYMVFRGLTHYHLREYRHARYYLERGAHLYRYGKVRWLPAPARQELHLALRHLRGVRARVSAR